MPVTVREQSDPRRCAYCHDELAPIPDPLLVTSCGGCGAHVHVSCWAEHGGCPVMGCARPVVAGGQPHPVAWAQFVADADAWVALGGALDEAAWGPTVDGDDGEAGGSSWTSSSAAA
jgi:hypothetical protein